MSFREEKVLSLAADLSKSGSEKLHSIFSNVLNNGIHGIGFSPYETQQKPGEQITEAQIRRRMAIIAPHTNWIRSFSCTEGNENIPRIAREFGIKTLVGAWLGDDPETNEKEIENLLLLANEGVVDIAAVGNEVMYRGDLTEQELLRIIAHVKAEIPNVPVGYVDAYYEFENRPAITAICDVILANCYPFWEGCPMDFSLLYMKDMYRRTLRVAGGKKVIISETGWPNEGAAFEGAQPSKESAIRYFVNAQQWAREEEIDMFYFSSFDEAWKTGDEGDVGAFWGLWDENEKLKY